MHRGYVHLFQKIIIAITVVVYFSTNFIKAENPVDLSDLQYKLNLIKNYHSNCNNSCLADSLLTSLYLSAANDLLASNIDSSILLAQQAIQHAHNICWHKGIALANQQIADYYFSKKNYPNALEFYTGAITAWQGKAISEPVKKKNKKKSQTVTCPPPTSFYFNEKALVFQKIAHIYQLQKNYKNAEANLNSALENSEKAKNEALYNDLTRQMGLLQEEKGDLNLAIVYFNKLINSPVDLNDAVLFVQDQGKLAALYIANNDMAEAERKYRQLKKIANRKGVSQQITEAFIKLENLIIQTKKNNDELLKIKKSKKRLTPNELAPKEKINYDSIAQAQATADSIIDETKKKILLDSAKSKFLKTSLDSLKEIKTRQNKLILEANKKGDTKRATLYVRKNMQIDSLITELQDKDSKLEDMMLASAMQDWKIRKNELLNEKKKLVADSIAKAAEIKNLNLQIDNRSKDDTINLIKGVTLALVISSLLIFFFYKRKRDAEQKQKEIALSLQISDTKMNAFRAQMNPHFIFNALLTITEFVKSRKPKEAVKYLEKFSSVMRFVVDNSQKKEIALIKDLEALEQYIELEKLNKDFNFKIEIDNTVDRGYTKIPPLILQPFVENAIKHGLRPKEENRQLHIYITMQSEDVLKYIVQDNGVGRSFNKDSGKSVFSQNESMGIKITQERLNVYNQQNNVNAYFTIHDLFDENKKPAGTKVELLLPLV